MTELKGTSLRFIKRTPTGETNALGEPTYSSTTIDVEDCLVEPIGEPTNAREQQAIQQGKLIVRIHLPKAFAGDVSDSIVAWGKHNYRVDHQGDEFMAENTPGRWNRLFRAEVIDG